MADKEATVYIVDVGESMGQKHQGRSETDLDWAMQYVWDKITTTVSHANGKWVESVSHQIYRLDLIGRQHNLE